MTVAAWFREVIKSKVHIKYMALGGYLDGTMMSGDTVANTVKFPIIGGDLPVYKLTGAIESVPNTGADLSTVQVTMEDFEASAWWRIQDAYKSGASEQDSLATLLTRAIRQKRDKIKLDALVAFEAASGGLVTTIGDGSDIPDLLHFEQARAEIAGTGAEDEEVFAPIPAMWFSQLKFYKEFADAQYVGSADAPFSQAQRLKMKTVQGVTYMELPDSYFTGPADQLYTYMWAKSALGAETPWSQDIASITQHTDRQGSPYLAKTSISGAAVGIEPKGVKRLHMAKITAPTRPVAA